MNTTKTAPQVIVKTEMKATVAGGDKVMLERHMLGRTCLGYRVRVVTDGGYMTRQYSFSLSEKGKAHDYYLTLLVEMDQAHMANW